MSSMQQVTLKTTLFSWSYRIHTVVPSVQHGCVRTHLFPRCLVSGSHNCGGNCSNRPAMVTWPVSSVWGYSESMPGQNNAASTKGQGGKKVSTIVMGATCRLGFCHGSGTHVKKDGKMAALFSSLTMGEENSKHNRGESTVMNSSNNKNLEHVILLPCVLKWLMHAASKVWRHWPMSMFTRGNERFTRKW